MSVRRSRNSMSKLEQLFEQATLKERDNYDEGADDSTTEVALARLKSFKEKQPEVLPIYWEYCIV